MERRRAVLWEDRREGRPLEGARSDQGGSQKKIFVVSQAVPEDSDYDLRRQLAKSYLLEPRLHVSNDDDDVNGKLTSERKACQIYTSINSQPAGRSLARFRAPLLGRRVDFCLAFQPGASSLRRSHNLQ